MTTRREAPEIVTERGGYDFLAIRSTRRRVLALSGIRHRSDVRLSDGGEGGSVTLVMLTLIAGGGWSAAVSLIRIANALRGIQEELKKVRQNQEAPR